MGIADKDSLNKTLTENMDDVFGGAYGKFYGKTNPSFDKATEKKIVQQELDEAKLRNDDIKLHIDAAVDVKDKDKAVDDFEGYVDKKYPDLSEEKRGRMVDSFETGIENSKLDYWYVKLLNYSPHTRALVFKNRYDTSPPAEKEEMLKTIQENYHINSDEFYDEMLKLGFTDKQLEGK